LSVFVCPVSGFSVPRKPQSPQICLLLRFHLQSMSHPHYTLHDIGRDCGSMHVTGNGKAIISEIAWDTRLLVSPGDTIFIALKGQDRDGHQFIQSAWDLGVRSFLISDPAFEKADGNFICVTDTLHALQLWATAHRKSFAGKLIGITGSNGKTIVKEWLGEVLESIPGVYKSPRSFNSQLGVPVSLLGMDTTATIALLEAGISRVGEMEALAAMLQPNTGLLTHMGDAHAEGFNSFEEKLNEKIKLFHGCETVLLNGDDARITNALLNAGITQLMTIGREAHNEFQLTDLLASQAGGWSFSVKKSGEEYPFYFPVSGDAALENISLVILAARYLSVPWDDIRNCVAQLRPVTMRTEMITDNPEVTVINDAYNADSASVLNAFSLLQGNGFHNRKILILSDLEHQGAGQMDVQQALLNEAQKRFSNENIILIGSMFSALGKSIASLKCYTTTADLITEFDYSLFRESTVLLKGARRFELEQLIPFLTRRANATYFKINMNSLAHNYRQLRRKLDAGTKMMAMVKAFSYGSGSWEIAEALAREGVDYLAVASPSEGIALRTRGVRTPVMVMNSDEFSLSQLIHFSLEPEVYDLPFLQLLASQATLSENSNFHIHLKVDTGMSRLGFSVEDAQDVGAFLSLHPKIKVVSILSHLAGADDSSLDAFTEEQIKKFTSFCDSLSVKIGYRPMRHILNTAGLLRFPQYQFDMVRAGIGIYGVSPVPGESAGLEEIGSLHSAVQQVHEYAAGTWIGYGCSQRTERKSRIATIPIGYADGIRRSLSNGKLEVLIRGMRAPVFGRVCMDMIMVDVTDVPGVKSGDEVVVFGSQGDAFISVNELAAKCDTIAYEILSGISQRVRRIYVRE
jgi:Alr-MurF fusion protein